MSVPALQQRHWIWCASPRPKWDDANWMPSLRTWNVHFCSDFGSRPSPKREPSIKLNAIIDSGKAIVKSQNLAAGAFERIVFTAVRMFIMFWAVIIVLAFIVTTIGYIGTFFPDKPTTPDEPDQTVFTQIVNHPHWEAFVAYLSALFLLFCALTMISIVLLLLAIERNTRKSNEETRKT